MSWRYASTPSSDVMRTVLCVLPGTYRIDTFHSC
jgi:hypothetical protein